MKRKQNSNKKAGRADQRDDDSDDGSGDMFDYDTEIQNGGGELNLASIYNQLQRKIGELSDGGNQNIFAKDAKSIISRPRME